MMAASIVEICRNGAERGAGRALNGTGTLIFLEALSQFPERGQQAPHRSHTARLRVEFLRLRQRLLAERRQPDPFSPSFQP